MAREDVKSCTHELNRRHLEAFVGLFKMRSVNEISEDRVNAWLSHLKALGHNPGGQSLSLRILRTFCRFCRKKHWLERYPFEDFKIPKSEFVGRYLSDDERGRLLFVNPRYDVDRHLNRALTFGLYSLLRISQVFHADWNHFKAPDQLWVPGIKGQDGRWITLHPKALKAMGAPKASGPLFDRWETLAAFREAVYKKAKRERLHGVRFHETKHTGNHRRCLKRDTRSQRCARSAAIHPGQLPTMRMSTNTERLRGGSRLNTAAEQPRVKEVIQQFSRKK